MDLKLVGYAPDADPGIPGVIVDCAAFVGSLRGMEAAPSGIATGLPALAAACLGAASFRDLTNVQTTAAGTATKLYTAGTTSWTDRSGAATFNAATANRWSFAQYGNVTLAANKGDTIQARTTGDFANAGAAAPKAAFIETVNDFVFAANVNDGADKPDGWHCSALGDYTDWAASIATQSANGRVTDVPGPLTGAKRLADSIVLYKRKAIYVGNYVGPDIIWAFQLASAEAGAIHHNAIVSVDYAHYLMGDDDFYRFDGSRPVPIGADVRKSVFGEFDRTASHLCTALLERVNARIYFFYPDSSNAGYANRGVVLNYKTGRWGRHDFPMETTLQFIQAALTYDDLGTYYATYDDFPNASYDTAFLGGAIETPAYFDTSHVLRTLTGAPGTSRFTLGEVGSDEIFTTLTRAQLRLLTAPTTAAMTNYYKHSSADAFTTDVSTPIGSSRFDVLRSARWHKLQFDFTGAIETPGLRVDSVPDGTE
jgi:hypothetical protein